MLNKILALVCAISLGSTAVNAGDLYRVEIDLTNVVDDKINVIVHTPPVTLAEVTFVFPVSVPGTYEIHQWYRLVHNFKAYGENGKPLTVKRSMDSQFVISNATTLSRVEYMLDDSFDDVDDRVDIFPPAGTGFEKDSVFVLNHGGIVGYIDGYQKLPFQVSIEKPKHLYGATALKVQRLSETSDRYFAESYDALVDGPMVYCIPDTATFEIAGVKVLVALAHKTDAKLAPEYAKSLKKVCRSISNFIGEMPVKEYAFIFYLWNRDTVNVKGAGAKFGALEHNYSSFYFWGYAKRPFGLADIAAHEFLHILVPLNVHSKEIEEFNFRKPEMSEHLWLYEGVTEYFAQLSSVHDSTSTEISFLRDMKGKTRGLRFIPKDFCFTEFSRNVLTEENQKLYPLVYTYGALNAMLLDITIRESSNGERGLLDLIFQLKKKYGASRPFNDADLFNDIQEIAGPKVREYCDLYIGGRNKIPMHKLELIGWSFQDSTTTPGLSYGIDFKYKKAEGDSTETLYLTPLHGNPMGIMAGDKLVSIYGKDPEEVGQNVWRAISKPVESKELVIVVKRGEEIVELVGKPETAMLSEYNVVSQMTEPSEKQTALKNAVLYGR